MNQLAARRMLIDGKVERENKFSDGLVQTAVSSLDSTDSTDPGGFNIELM